MAGLGFLEQKFLLEALSGGKTTMIPDDRSFPSIMTRIPRFNISDVVSGGPDIPHPMFIIDGNIKDEIYIGKYLASSYRDRAYSLPDKEPLTNISLTDAAKLCTDKGPGWHVMTNAEYAGIALWCRANGFMPRGNNNNGRSTDKIFERGIIVKRQNATTGLPETGGYLTDMYIPTSTSYKLLRNMGDYTTDIEPSGSTLDKRCIAVDKNGYVYVANYNGTTISKYFAGQKIKDISIGYTTPHGLCVDRDGTTIWGITNNASTNYIFKIVNDTMVWSISVGSSTGGWGICCDDNGVIWASLQTTGNVAKIDSNTLTALPSFALAAGLCRIIYTKSGFILATNNTNKTVYKINKTTNAIESSYVLKDNALDICTDLTGRKAYVQLGVTGANTDIAVVDLYTNEIKYITFPNVGYKHIQVSINNDIIVFSSDGYKYILRNDKIVDSKKYTNVSSLIPYVYGDANGVQAANLFGWLPTNKHYVGKTIRFDYTGAVQEFETRNIKKMKIECYGASAPDSGYGTNNGGYVYGDLPLTKSMKLFIYCGGKGMSLDNGGWGGGWNGGGLGGSRYDTNGSAGPSGGGATDIRTVKDNLASRLIVAGGAGAGASYSFGGSGGHWYGMNGSSGSANATGGIGGTQTTGYALGIGQAGSNGNSSADASNHGGGGAGGGYYGGYAGIRLNTGAFNSPGAGGGSSYVSGNPNCPAIHPDGLIFENSGSIPGKNPMSTHGYVIITVLEVFDGPDNNVRRDLFKFGTSSNSLDLPTIKNEIGLDTSISTEVNMSEQSLVQKHGLVTQTSVTAAYPSIIKESDTSYKMWFTGYDGTNQRILYSESTDGKVWSTPILVLDKGGTSYNSIHNMAPFVIKESDTSYKMWFTGSDNVNYRTMYSTSTDGKTWTTPILVMNVGTTSYNTVNNSSISIIKESDTSYKMWFTGYDGTTNRILYSESTDGKVWSTPILIMDKNINNSFYMKNCLVPSVIKDVEKYKMVFIGQDSLNKCRLLYTESNDGVNWDKAKLILDCNTNPYNAYQSSTPYFIKDNDIYKLWFSGTSNLTNFDILYTEFTFNENKFLTEDNSLGGTVHPVGKLRTYGERFVMNAPLTLVIDKGTNSENSVHSFGQCVIKDGATYKMWFGGVNATNYSIMYSESTDGKTWITPVAVLGTGTSYTTTGALYPYVIKDGATYKMWFAGSDGSYYRLLYTTSTDGKTWSTPVLVLDKGGISANSNSNYCPFIIKENDTSYKMWFGSYDGTTYRILYSESTNGTTWSTPIIVMDRYTSLYSWSHAFSPFVIKESANSYKMLFSGSDGTNYRILYSTSKDGKNWTIPSSTPVIDKGLNIYNSLQTYSVSLIKENDIYRTWVSMQDTTNYRIGYTELVLTKPTLTYDKSTVFNMTKDNKQVLMAGSDPVLSIDIKNNSINTLASTAPYIINDNGIYRMWFTSSDGTTNRILYSESTDNVNWSIPVIALNIGSTYATNGISKACVIKDGSTYKLWCQGADATYWRILYSESTDAKTWTTPILVLDKGGTSYNTSYSLAPSVIKDGSTYKMWFSGSDATSMRILYSESTDGKVWSTPILVMDKNTCSYNTTHSLHPNVIKDNGVYRMTFTGYYPGYIILYSESMDGKRWSTPIPFITNTSANNNVTQSWAPYVLKESDNLYRVYYTGNNGSTYDKILYSELRPVKYHNKPINKYTNNLVSGTQVYPVNAASKLNIEMMMGKDVDSLGLNIKSTPLKNAGVPVMTYNTTYTSSPCVLYDNGKYRMWFHGWDSSHTRILYSESVDGKSNWSTPILVVNYGGTSSNSVNAITPTVIKDGSTYKMWFSGNSTTAWSLIYCESTDGINWGTQQVILGTAFHSTYAALGIGGSEIIKEGNMYKGWFSCYDASGIMRVLYSESNDGKTWGTPILCMNIGVNDLDYNFAGCIRIAKENGIYKSLYTGFDKNNKSRILYSESIDGKIWRKPSIMIDSNTNVSLDAGGISNSCFIKENGIYRVWYSYRQNASYNYWSIGYREITINENTAEKITMEFDAKSIQNLNINLDKNLDNKWSVPQLVMTNSVSSYASSAIIPQTLIKDNNKYKMWLHLDNGSRRYYAYTESIDMKTWSTPILLDTLNNAAVCAYNVLGSSIIKDGNLYKMWFVSASSSTVRTFNYSTSTDGINWNAPSTFNFSEVIDGMTTLNITVCRVIKENGIYKMWFSSSDSNTKYRLYYSTSDTGITWNKPVRVVDTNINSSYHDGTDVVNVDIIKENNIYRLFFKVSIGSTNRIFEAYSHDGIILSSMRKVMTIGETSYNSIKSGVPVVINENGKTKMIFTGNNGTVTQLLYSESSNGNMVTTEAGETIVEYKKYPELPKHVYSLTNSYGGTYFIIKDNGIYKLWYSDKSSGSYVIKYVYSYDLKVWSIPQTVMSYTSVSYNQTGSFNPCIIKDGSTYKMWFIGLGSDNVWRVCYSTSTDGTTWVNPVLSLDKNIIPANSSSNVTVSVIKETSSYRLFVIGNNGTIATICTATSTDGINWTGLTPTNINNFDICVGGAFDCHMYKENGYFKAFITSTDTLGKLNILYLTSLDSINWSMPIRAFTNNTINQEVFFNPIILIDDYHKRLFINMKIPGNNTSELITKEFNEDLLFTEVKDTNLVKGIVPLASRYILNTTVIKDSSDGLYKMWGIMNDGTYKRIFYSESTDKVNWSLPRLTLGVNDSVQNAYGSTHPAVIKDGSTYKMWFVGYTAASSTKGVICYSESTDGYTWSVPVIALNYAAGSLTTLTNGFTSGLTVIKESDTSYKLWVSGADGTNNYNRVHYSTSTDGKVWSNPVLQLDITAFGTSCLHVWPKDIIKENDIYKLIVLTNTNLGEWSSKLLESTDGLTWSTSNMKYIIRSGLSSLSILKESDRYTLFTNDNVLTNTKIQYSELKFSDMLANKTSKVFQSIVGDTDYTPKKIISLSSAATASYNSKDVEAPSIIKDNGIYKMWYGANDGTNSRILYSESIDKVNWSPSIMVLDKGGTTYNPTHSNKPCVIKDGTIYKMWFSGGNGTTWYLFYSESTDGKVWSTPILTLNVVASTAYTSIFSPCVIKDNGIYKVWFSGYDGTNWQILYTESVDGKTNWSTPVVVIAKNSNTYLTTTADRISIIKEGTLYKAIVNIYNGTSYRLAYYESTDGKVWSTEPKIISTDQAYGSFLFKDGNKYNLVYRTRYNPSAINILTSIDPSSFTKSNTEDISLNKLTIDNNPTQVDTSYVRIHSAGVRPNYTYKVGDSIRLDYSGAANFFYSSNIYRMRIDCYGGTGGTYGSYTGGKGGRAYGELTLAKPATLVAMIGQRGGMSTLAAPLGWNGGGLMTNDTASNAGAGATDLRTKLNNLYSRFIVAGGGGTADGNNANGGGGGGYIGVSGTVASGYTQTTGGTQTSGGNSDTLYTIIQAAFGQGAIVITDSGTTDVSRYGLGGGGWYGGGSAGGCGGSGGSSYIAGDPNCPTPHPDDIILRSTGTLAAANTEMDGYIVITVLETVGDDGTVKTYTGTGPITWNHDGTLDGITDLHGNVNELIAGLKVKDKVIYVIPDNDAAMQGKDLSLSSADWRCIDTNGIYINTVTGAAAYNFTANQAIAFSSAVATISPALLKALGIIPVDTTAVDDLLNLNISGEYLAIRGGSYANGAGTSGMYNLNFGTEGSAQYNGKSVSNGFRVCYYKP